MRLDKKTILFGAGENGALTYRRMAAADDIYPAYFIDNNPPPTNSLCLNVAGKPMDVPVYQPDILLCEDKSLITIVITPINPFCRQEIRSQLVDMGFEENIKVYFVNDDSLEQILCEKDVERFYSRPLDKNGYLVYPQSLLAHLYDIISQEAMIEEMREIYEDEAISEYIMLDKMPIPMVENRELYFANSDLDYWLSGLWDYQKIVERMMSPLPSKARVLDWGGATGRVARHFAARHPDYEISITDIQLRHVDYINRYAPKNLKSIRTLAHSSLPFADGYFDLIYAFSVFTHIDSLETFWLAQLHRVLKPNGTLYVTIMSDYYWSTLQNDNPKYRNVSCYKKLRAENQQRLPRERVVLQTHPGIEYSCDIFLTHDYIRRVWGRFFLIENIIERGHFTHDVIIMRKLPA